MTQQQSLPIRIQTPLLNDKAEVASLWQTVFEDSDAFINLFFSRVYKPENTLVAKRGNRIVSALQMIPYDLKIAGNIFPSAYVCGVCTHPSARGKGIMKTLMTAAMEQMHRRAYTLSTLIPAEPWLFDFYQPFGYTIPVNYLAETYVPPPSTASFPYSFVECRDLRYFSFYNQKQLERENVLLHSEYDYQTILHDFFQENGHVYVALEENQPVGIAFAQPKPETNTIIIKEIFYNHPTIKDALIHHINSIFRTQTIEVHRPVSLPKDFRPEKHRLQPSLQEIRPYGLACALNDATATTIPDLYMTLILD